MLRCLVPWVRGPWPGFVGLAWDVCWLLFDSCFAVASDGCDCYDRGPSTTWASSADDYETAWIGPCTTSDGEVDTEAVGEVGMGEGGTETVCCMKFDAASTDANSLGTSGTEVIECSICGCDLACATAAMT